MKNVFSVLALVATILAALNVYGDFSDVEERARGALGEDGELFLTEVNRNPLFQRYVFLSKGRSRQTVTCRREYLLLGEYLCVSDEAD